VAAEPIRDRGRPASRRSNHEPPPGVLIGSLYLVSDIHPFAPDFPGTVLPRIFDLGATYVDAAVMNALSMRARRYFPVDLALARG
jgi:hypothetical protein